MRTVHILLVLLLTASLTSAISKNPKLRGAKKLNTLIQNTLLPYPLDPKSSFFQAHQTEAAASTESSVSSTSTTDAAKTDDSAAATQTESVVVNKDHVVVSDPITTDSAAQLKLDPNQFENWKASGILPADFNIDQAQIMPADGAGQIDPSQLKNAAIEQIVIDGGADGNVASDIVQPRVIYYIRPQVVPVESASATDVGSDAAAIPTETVYRPMIRYAYDPLPPVYMKKEILEPIEAPNDQGDSQAAPEPVIEKPVVQDSSNNDNADEIQELPTVSQNPNVVPADNSPAGQDVNSAPQPAPELAYTSNIVNEDPVQPSPEPVQISQDQPSNTDDNQTRDFVVPDAQQDVQQAPVVQPDVQQVSSSDQSSANTDSPQAPVIDEQPTTNYLVAQNSDPVPVPSQDNGSSDSSAPVPDNSNPQDTPVSVSQPDASPDNSASASVVSEPESEKPAPVIDYAPKSQGVEYLPIQDFAHPMDVVQIPQDSNPAPENVNNLDYQPVILPNDSFDNERGVGPIRVFDNKPIFYDSPPQLADDSNMMTIQPYYGPIYDSVAEPVALPAAEPLTYQVSEPVAIEPAPEPVFHPIVSIPVIKSLPPVVAEPVPVKTLTTKPATNQVLKKVVKSVPQPVKPAPKPVTTTQTIKKVVQQPKLVNKKVVKTVPKVTKKPVPAPAKKIIKRIVSPNQLSQPLNDLVMREVQKAINSQVA